MRRAVATALVAIMLVTAGCNGFVDGDNSTDGGTPGTAPETTAPDTPAPTPEPTSTPTELEQEYIDSGNEFARVVGERLSKRFTTSLVDGTGYRNKTFHLTVQLSKGEPLYSGMMNTTQTVAATLTFKTATDDSVAMADGTNGKVHFPEDISVDVLGPEGNYVGSFDLDPKHAFGYRTRQVDRERYAESIVNTLYLERDYERGIQEPVWYLNRSNLVDFRIDYIDTLNRRSDPEKTAYHKTIPNGNITLYPSTSEFRNEFDWDDDEYGAYFTSAEATHWGAYRVATNESWALPPSAITVYMHREGKDFRSRMPVEHVYWINNRKKDHANLTAFIESADSELIHDGE